MSDWGMHPSLDPREIHSYGVQPPEALANPNEFAYAADWYAVNGSMMAQRDYQAMRAGRGYASRAASLPSIDHELTGPWRRIRPSLPGATNNRFEDDDDDYEDDYDDRIEAAAETRRPVDWTIDAKRLGKPMAKLANYVLNILTFDDNTDSHELGEPRYRTNMRGLLGALSLKDVEKHEEFLAYTASFWLQEHPRTLADDVMRQHASGSELGRRWEAIADWADDMRDDDDDSDMDEWERADGLWRLLADVIDPLDP